MAIIQLKCQNCGGQIQMDDAMEKGFCMYCGSAVQVKDEVQRIKIEHSGKVEISGKVKIDEKEKMQNYFKLAENSFRTGNYAEAYLYYTKYLECDINNWVATFYKGLCAIYSDFRRTDELVLATRTALTIIGASNEKVAENQAHIFDAIYNYLKSADSSTNLARGYTFDDKNAAEIYFNKVYRGILIAKSVSDIIDDNAMRFNAYLEGYKKSCLDVGISICKKGLKNVSYHSGYKTVVNDNRVSTEPVTEAMRSPYIQVHKSYLTALKSDYNNLPGIRNALYGYDQELRKNRENIELYNRELNKYFQNNPEKDAAYHSRKSAIFFALFGGLCFTAILFAIFLGLTEAVKSVIFILLLLASLGLLTAGIIKASKEFKTRKEILENMPAEISKLRIQSENSKVKTEEIQKLKNQFISLNMKK